MLFEVVAVVVVLVVVDGGGGGAAREVTVETETETEEAATEGGTEALVREVEELERREEKMLAGLWPVGVPTLLLGDGDAVAVALVIDGAEGWARPMPMKAGIEVDEAVIAPLSFLDLYSLKLAS